MSSSSSFSSVSASRNWRGTDFLPAESGHAPVTGFVQHRPGFPFQDQYIRHVFYVSCHRHRPGDGMLPEKILPAQIQLELEGEAGAGHMDNLPQIQSHSILLTWYRGYSNKKKQACQILFFKFSPKDGIMAIIWERCPSHPLRSPLK